MTIGIGYPSVIDADTATVSGGSWLVGLPAANALTRDLSRPARSADVLTTSTRLTIDHGSAKTARALVLVGHNLAAGNTVQWLRGTTSGGSDVADSGELQAWAITPPATGGHAVLIVLPESSAARYDTLLIDAAGHPAGYVEVQYVWVSDLWVPEIGPQVGLQDGLVSLGRVERSSTGALWANAGGTLRQVSLVLPYLSLAEGDHAHEMQRVADVCDWCLYVPDLSDRAVQQRYGFVATFEELSAVDYPYYRARSLPLRLTEVR